MRKVRVGPKKVKAKVIAKVRRTKQQAYGTPVEWSTLCKAAKKRDGYRCRICGATEFLQVDHIIQVAKGGRTVLANLWTICDICHSKRPGHKQAKHLILHKRNSQ